MLKKLALSLLVLVCVAGAAAIMSPTPAASKTCPKGTHLFTCPTYSFCCPDNALCACL